jgi:hypothetical protein
MAHMRFPQKGHPTRGEIYTFLPPNSRPGTIPPNWATLEIQRAIVNHVTEELEQQGIKNRDEISTEQQIQKAIGRSLARLNLYLVPWVSQDEAFPPVTAQMVGYNDSLRDHWSDLRDAVCKVIDHCDHVN